jgi:transcriptional regulator with XRE-family HTH domain
MAGSPSEPEPVATDREQPADDSDRPEVSEREAAARMGANVAFHRQAAGLTLRELGEATEVDRTYLHRVENGRAGVPRISLVVRLAASLNVPCARVTTGIAWNPRIGAFKQFEVDRDNDAGRKRLGQNVRRVRRRMNISQQALGERASICRGDVVDSSVAAGISGSLRRSGWPGRWESTSQTCSREWEAGTSARSRLPNTVRRIIRPSKPSVTFCSPASGGKDDRNGRLPKRWA